MVDGPLRPKLRSLEWVVVPHEEHEKALVLRDTEGIAPSAIVIPIELAAVVARFDGARDVGRIAEEASRELDARVDRDDVEKLARELDDAFLLDTPRLRARRNEVIRGFKDATVRPAHHAGGAYHSDAHALTAFIERECIAKAPSRTQKKKLVGLCAPHMDLWRAAVGYGYAYRALREALPPDVDTFVLLGTSHAAMRRPFAICEKTFETPLGDLEPDHAACADLMAASRFDLRADEHFHRTEHSLEFQAVFLKHALGDREARIVPVLCGLGDAQARGVDPATGADAESFLRALSELVLARAGKVMVIAGADLAHVGPRFGDPAPLDDLGKEKLAARDAESIALAASRAEKDFFRQVAADLDTRRVCGLGPIYTMLRALPEGARGEKLLYSQHVDPEEGSIVSHTSMAFYR